MQVDGTLSLWTTLLGWHYYNVIWGLLVASGIAFLPIAGMLIDHLLNVRSRSSTLNGSGDALLAPIELDLFMMVLVLLLAVRPSIASGINPSSLRYTTDPTPYSPAVTTGTIGSTGTTYDTALATTAIPGLATSTVAVPPVWHVVMKVTQGFSYALIKNTDMREGTYRALRDIANRAMISDPGLKLAVEDFHSECYSRALSRYRSEGEGTGFVEGKETTAGALGFDQEGADIGWIGSRVFQVNDYPTRRVRHPVVGFPYNAAVDTQFEGTTPTHGAPLCSDYWVSIRDTIYDNAVADNTVGAIGRARDVIDTVSNIGTENSSPFRDNVARLYLSNTTMDVSMTADEVIALRLGGGDMSWLESATRNVAGVFQAIELAKTAAAAEILIDVVINMLVYLQAYALMFLYLSIPIIMLFSRYSWQGVVNVSVMILLLKFLPFLWALIAWMDNSNGLALWNDKSWIGTLVSLDISDVKARLVHSISIAALYGLSAGLFFALVALSGYRASHAVMHAGRGMSGTGPGISATGGASGVGSVARGGGRAYAAGKAAKTRIDARRGE